MGAVPLVAPEVGPMKLRTVNIRHDSIRSPLPSFAAEFEKHDRREDRIYRRDNISVKLLDREKLTAETRRTKLFGRNHRHNSRRQHDPGAREGAFLRCLNLESRLMPDPDASHEDGCIGRHNQELAASMMLLRASARDPDQL